MKKKANNSKKDPGKSVKRKINFDSQDSSIADTNNNATHIKVTRHKVTGKLNEGAGPSKEETAYERLYRKVKEKRNIVSKTMLNDNTPSKQRNETVMKCLKKICHYRHVWVMAYMQKWKLMSSTILMM